MRVRMKTAAACAKWAAGAGELSPDLPEAEAKALVASGHAILVDDGGREKVEVSRQIRKAVREKAVAKPAETADKN